MTTNARKPRAQKAPKPVLSPPCDHFLKVRVSGDQYAHLMATAAARGQRLSTLVRDLLLERVHSDDLASTVARLEKLVLEATQEPTTHGGKDLVLETFQQGREAHAMLRALCMQADPAMLERVIARTRAV